MRNQTQKVYYVQWGFDELELVGREKESRNKFDGEVDGAHVVEVRHGRMWLRVGEQVLAGLVLLPDAMVAVRRVVVVEH